MPRRRTHIPTILIDQNTLCREGLVHILQGTRFRVLASAARLEDIDAATVPKAGETLLLVGLNEGHEETLNDVRRLRDIHPSARRVILADRFIPQQLTLAIRAGVDGYLLKTVSGVALIKSLDLVFMGESVFSAGLLPSACGPGGSSEHLKVGEGNSEGVRGMFEGNGPAEETGLEAKDEPDLDDAIRPLSYREREILKCIVHGASNKHIARQFAITEATVKVHMKAILRKIRVRNRTQAAVWAMNHEALLGVQPTPVADASGVPSPLPRILNGGSRDHGNGGRHLSDPPASVARRATAAAARL